MMESSPKNETHLWYAQVFLGICINLNIFLSHFLAPFDVYLTRNNNFDSTHWINTITLFAGFAAILFPKNCRKSEIAIIVVNIINICICLICAFSDVLNFILIAFEFHRSFIAFIPNLLTDRHIFLIYNLIDLLISIPSIYISSKLIRNRVSEDRNIAISHKLYVAGIVNFVVTLLVILNHIFEHFSYGPDYIMYITSVDESSWIFIHLALALLTIYSTNLKMQTSAFLLSGILLAPTLFYALWDIIEINSTYMRGRSIIRLIYSFLIGFIRFLSVSTLFVLFSISNPSKCSIGLTNIHRKIFRSFSLVFIILGVFHFLIATLFTFSQRGLFHYSIEVQLAFLAVFLAIFSLLSAHLKNNFIPLVIVISSCLSILKRITSNYLLFVLLYRPGEIWTSDIPFILQPLEISANILVTFSTVFLIMFLVYFIRKKAVKTTENESMKRNALKIMTIGIFFLFLAVFSFYNWYNRSIDFSEGSKYIYLWIFFYCNTSFLMLFNGIIQIIFSRFLTSGPLIPSIMLVDSVTFFFDILTTMDYSGGYYIDFTWKIHQLSNFLSLFGCLANAAILLDILNFKCLEKKIQVENPLFEIEEN